MAVFVLMVIKITTTLFSISDPSLISFSAASVPMLLIWMTDHSSTELLAFKSTLGAIVYLLLFLAWLISPWLVFSNGHVMRVVGSLLVIGLNLLDAICCILSDLTMPEKTLNLLFSLLIILLSCWTIKKTIS